MSKTRGRRLAPGGWPGKIRGAATLLAGAALLLGACGGRQLRVAPPGAGNPGPFAPPAPVPQAALATDEGPLRVTVDEAVLLALRHSRAFAVERHRPALARTAEERERAAFDPVLSAGASRQWQRGAAGGTARGGDLSVSAEGRLPGGTAVQLGVAGQLADGPGGDAARLGLTVTQALLKGVGPGANLASLRQARLDTRASEYELRGFAEALVAQTEEACWAYALARRQGEIVAASLALAQERLAETEERIRVGQLAEVERVAAEAEVALRREGDIDARSRLGVARLTLLRLLSPPGGSPWHREVEVLDAPSAPEGGVDDVEDHVGLALSQRPELNQARLQVRRGDLEVVKTRNGVLPRLDAFVTLGKSGYAGSFGGALADLGGDGYDLGVGLSGELPWGNRAAGAAERRATLARGQAQEALANLTQLAQVDVRTAHLEAQRLQAQVAATAATRRLQAEKLRGETERFRVGKSTSLAVAQAQRDLLQSELAETQAVVSYRLAVVDLHRQDGSLLLRRGIAAPGAEP